MSIFTSTIRIPAATAAAVAALLLGGCSKDSENGPGGDATATAQITAHVSEMAASVRQPERRTHGCECSGQRCA